MSQAREDGSERSLRAVWCLNVGLALCCMALWYFFLRGKGVPSTRLHVPWPLLALGFAAAEKWAVHLRIRGRQQAVGLAELPLVLGIAFCSPGQVISAQVVGGAAALLLDRRVVPVKLAFNLALFGLSSAVAAAVFANLGGGFSVPGERVWLSLGAATLTADLVAFLALVTLYGLLGGLPPVRDAGWMLMVGALETVGMTIVALLPLTVLGFDPKSSWLLVAPTLAAVIAFRSLTRDRVRADRLEQLYKTVREADLPNDLEQRVHALLAGALIAFEATYAELLLGDDGRYRRFRAPAGDLEVLAELPAADIRLLEEASDRAVLVRARRSGDADHLESRGLVRAMATLMQGHAGTGLLVIGDRSDHDASFLDEDLVRFEAFAAQANAGLQVVRLRRLERQSHEEARQDGLTQLANRKRYGELVEQALSTGESIAVASLDIDDFKVINGRLGHDAGDLALTELAQRIQSSLRAGDTAVRLGGDEFACVLRGTTTLEDGVERTRSALNVIAQPLIVDGHRFLLAASAGIAVAETGMTPNDLLTRADLALEAAKRQGSGRVAAFEPHLLDAARERRRLEAELARGIENREIEAFYQPLVNLATGSLVGFEALARWRHPERGLLSPSAFLPTAEATGLVLPLGRDMLRQACSQASRFDAIVGDSLFVSANLSAAQLSDASLATDVTSALASAATDPGRLWLEVTETIAMADIEQNLARLCELRELGVVLALDDFGTGHSSLAYLQRFPFSVIKLARELADNVDRSEADCRIADIVVDLAAGFGLRSVAEGIERPEQAQALRRYEIGQGFLWGKPIPAAEAEALARTWKRRDDPLYTAA
jgi:diguanylate cyclase (GGDEF)-like protein